MPSQQPRQHRLQTAAATRTTSSQEAGPQRVCNSAEESIMRTMKAIGLSFGIGLIAMAATTAKCTAETYTYAEVGKHVGTTGTVCGNVADSTVSKYGVGGRGKPISFQMDKPEPDTPFFFVAWAAKDADIETFRGTYKDKKVCVTGKIGNFNGIPYILTTD